MPGRLLTAVVGLVLVGAALSLLAHSTACQWACIIVLAVRGLAGIIAPALGAKTRVLPFYWLNRLFYSPLCLFLAALIAAGS